MFGFGLFSPISMISAREYDFDLLMQDAFILDGSGTDGYFGDIGILGERIMAIGRLNKYRARRVINIENRVVTPGFIDIHSHSEDELLVNPRAESKIRQGVTTEIIGQDGNSIAPLSLEMQSSLNQQYDASYGLKVDWHDFYGYFRRLQEQGIAVNVGTMLGQGTLREYVIGRENRDATRSEISRMKELVQQSLDDGALGVSSGLEYTPGAFASSVELIEICKVMHFAFGIYATHMRNEADFLVEALDEAIAVAKGADVSLHIAHLKCIGKRNWSKLETVFDMIRHARRRGISLSMDRYPYIAYNTSLSSLFPVWARSGTHGDFLSRLQSASIIPRIKEETLAKVEMIGSWDAVMITSVESAQNKYLEGKRVSEVAGGNGVDEFEFVRRLIIEEGNGVDMCGFAMSDKNTADILAHPSCMIASDASARADYGILNKSKPHPRTFGTFPRVLAKYARDDHILTLTEAVRKMTHLPASRLGLKHRGLLKKGFFADLVVFNPKTIRDNATFEAPYQYPSGINFVLVNGVVVVESDHHTGALPGRILKRGHIPQNY